jgi:hypothetical protein
MIGSLFLILNDSSKKFYTLLLPILPTLPIFYSIFIIRNNFTFHSFFFFIIPMTWTLLNHRALVIYLWFAGLYKSIIYANNFEMNFLLCSLTVLYYYFFHCQFFIHFYTLLCHKMYNSYVNIIQDCVKSIQSCVIE